MTDLEKRADEYAIKVADASGELVYLVEVKVQFVCIQKRKI